MNLPEQGTTIWMNLYNSLFIVNLTITAGPVFCDGKYWYEVAAANRKRYGYACFFHNGNVKLIESPIKGCMIMEEGQ